MINYQFSDAVTEADLKRWGVFTAMDVRKHKQEHLAHQGSQEFMKDMATVMGGNVQWKAASQKDGHMVALSIPECLPDRLGLVSGIADMTFLLDGLWTYSAACRRSLIRC